MRWLVAWVKCQTHVRVESGAAVAMYLEVLTIAQPHTCITTPSRMWYSRCSLQLIDSNQPGKNLPLWWFEPSSILAFQDLCTAVVATGRLPKKLGHLVNIKWRGYWVCTYNIFPSNMSKTFICTCTCNGTYRIAGKFGGINIWQIGFIKCLTNSKFGDFASSNGMT